jgi:uncharacterized protein (TIGR03437 family)
MAVLLALTGGWLLGASSSVPAVYLAGLPAAASVAGIAVDPSGNLLVAGTVKPAGADFSTEDAFAAKYSPDGKTQLYYVALAGSAADAAAAIAVDSAGNAYILGGTNSPDFPTTTGALQTSLNGASTAGFVVKMDAFGKIVYSTLFYAASGQSTSPRAMAVNAAGDVFVTGQTVGGNFPTTPSAVQATNPNNTFFVLRLSAAGDRLLYSVGGLGGKSIAVDAESNAYVLGTVDDFYGSDAPITANAYQSQVTPTICSSTMMFAFPCAHQYAAKLDPTGAKLAFCTFVSGTDQDAPSQILVDSNGDVYLAGTTGSTDYPTTSGVLQTQNHVVAPPASITPIEPFYYSRVQLNTGYVTKLSGDGTRLIYSTLLGGSRMDTVTGMALDSAGQVYVAASVQSPDFPGLPALQQSCLPGRLHGMPAVARLDAKGASVTGEWLVEGVNPGAAQTGLVANPQGGMDLVTASPYLAKTSATPADSIACIDDPFDWAQAGTISPGQLLSISGSSIGPATPAAYDANSSTLPTTLGGASILVNGVAAPLMYVSASQINFIVPYEIAGQTAVTLQLTTPGGATAQRTLTVAAMTPSLSTGGATDYPVCGGVTLQGSVAAVVLNADGTRNSCANLAPSGSTVSVFLNGAGVNVPGGTGSNPSSLVALQPTVADLSGNTVVRTVSVPWAPLGSWEVDIRLWTYPLYATLQLTVGGTAVREQTVAVWQSQ